MITLKRTNSDNPDFIGLVKYLDAYLAELDGEEHAFYNALNKIDAIKYVVVAYNDGTATGCGAIKEFGTNSMEVKRMYTTPAARGKGIATQILAELQQWATELGCKSCVLETGKRQPEAIALYKKSGFTVIPNYGKYAGMGNSVCFEKKLTTL